METLNPSLGSRNFHIPQSSRQFQAPDSKLRHLKHKIKLDKLSFRRAASRSELEQAFSLVYESYRKKGFVPEKKDHGMFFSLYSLLPGTIHVMIRVHQEIVSNLSAVPSSKCFGLPMDAIYKDELDQLRSQGRKVVELSALATSGKHRRQNIFLYQIQALYWYFIYQGVDDICVTVNPRHKDYYMHMFPFEEIGPVRHYDRVNAPAVGLRARVYESLECMIRIGNDLDLDRPFYRYLYELAGETSRIKKEICLGSGGMQLVLMRNGVNSEVLRYFLNLDPDVLQGLSRAQLDILEKFSPGLSYGV